MKGGTNRRSPKSRHQRSQGAARARVAGHVKVAEATAVWHAPPAARDVVILRMSAPFLDAAPPISVAAAQTDQVWAVGFPGVSDQYGRGLDRAEVERFERD